MPNSKNKKILEDFYSTGLAMGLENESLKRQTQHINTQVALILGSVSLSDDKGWWWSSVEMNRLCQHVVALNALRNKPIEEQTKELNFIDDAYRYPYFAFYRDCFRACKVLFPGAIPFYLIGLICILLIVMETMSLIGLEAFTLGMILTPCAIFALPFVLPVVLLGIKMLIDGIHHLIDFHNRSRNPLSESDIAILEAAYKIDAPFPSSDAAQPGVRLTPPPQSAASLKPRNTPLPVLDLGQLVQKTEELHGALQTGSSAHSAHQNLNAIQAKSNFPLRFNT